MKNTLKITCFYFLLLHITSYTLVATSDKTNVLSYYAITNQLDGQPTIDMNNVLRFYPVFSFRDKTDEVHITVYKNGTRYHIPAIKNEDESYWEIKLPPFELGEAIQRIEAEVKINTTGTYGTAMSEYRLWLLQEMKNNNCKSIDSCGTQRCREIMNMYSVVKEIIEGEKIISLIETYWPDSSLSTSVHALVKEQVKNFSYLESDYLTGDKISVQKILAKYTPSNETQKGQKKPDSGYFMDGMMLDKLYSYRAFLSSLLYNNDTSQFSLWRDSLVKKIDFSKYSTRNDSLIKLSTILKKKLVQTIDSISAIENKMWPGSGDENPSSTGSGSTRSFVKAGNIKTVYSNILAYMEVLTTINKELPEAVKRFIMQKLSDTLNVGNAVKPGDITLTGKEASLFYRNYKRGLRYLTALDPAERLGIFRLRYIPFAIIGKELVKPVGDKATGIFEVGMSFGDPIVSGDDFTVPPFAAERLGVAFAISNEFFSDSARVAAIALTYDFNSYGSIAVGSNFNTKDRQIQSYLSFGINKKAFEGLVKAIRNLFN